MYSICIYSKENNVNLAFVKANSYLLKKYKSSMPLEDKFSELKNLWKKEWNIIIDADWQKLHFPTQRSLDLFLLRWS